MKEKIIEYLKTRSSASKSEITEAIGTWLGDPDFVAAMAELENAGTISRKHMEPSEADFFDKFKINA